MYGSACLVIPIIYFYNTQKHPVTGRLRFVSQKWMHADKPSKKKEAAVCLLL